MYVFFEIYMYIVKKNIIQRAMSMMPEKHDQKYASFLREHAINAKYDLENGMRRYLEQKTPFDKDVVLQAQKILVALCTVIDLDGKYCVDLLASQRNWKTVVDFIASPSSANHFQRTIALMLILCQDVCTCTADIEALENEIQSLISQEEVGK
jgi:hypothetical protein